MSRQVTISSGALKGETRVSFEGKKYHSFEGIPYAKPPIGKLRFRDPQKPEPWTGVRDATKPGNMCPQIIPFTNTTQGSEDCLYLNVYTPSLPVEKDERLPVLFFIHGGSLVNGYSHQYQPDYFIRHNVILITVNYRLHILGFLCLNTPEVPGNAGMKDTVMALKWVHDNINNFNGDPKNVTVFGESVGASIVTSYLTSKMADGLYSKVIAESCNSITDVFMDQEDPIEKAKNIAKLLKKDVTNIESLYNFMVDVPVRDLVLAVEKASLNRQPGVVHPFFAPVIEKKIDGIENFLEEHPRFAIQEGRFNKVPILNGVASHEGAFTVTENKTGKVNFIQNLQLLIPKFLFIKQNTPESLSIAKRLHEYYFKGKDINDIMLSQYIDLLSDAYITRDTMMFVDLCTRYSNENIYLYRFAYHGSIQMSVLRKLRQGATHGDIVQYQFYRKPRAQKFTRNDLQIVNFLSEAWCNFARYGKPTWSNRRTEWLPYTPDKRCCLNIADNITMDTKMTWDRYEFWKSILGEKCEIRDTKKASTDNIAN